MSVTRPPRTCRRASAGPSANGAPHFRPPFPVVQAKLDPPRPKPGTIERVPLVHLLTGNRASVISVVAPPGYGKTTLLAQWFARERRPRAWLTIDDLDNDPAILLTYLAAGFDAIEPIGGTIAMHSGSGRRVVASVIPRLAATLHRWRQPGVLVLDNVHALVDRRSLDALAALLDHLPTGFRVAIAGRTEPDLPIGRFRAERDLLEIGPGLLALDEAETAALTAAAGWSLGPDEVRELRARTEGWAAGTYLATLAFRDDVPRPGAVRELSGDDRYIASYLRTEFEHGLGDEDVTLLTRTAILDTVKPATADAVTGMPGAGERLKTLARDNLFIQELGPPGSSYRYHNLVRDYLKAELDRREPGIAPELHRRAAAWYAGAGGIDRAVEHATATGDVDIAASFATAPAVPVFYRGHVATVGRWLARYELADFERHPPLAIIGAWVNILSNRPEAAERMADVVDRTPAQQPSVDRSGRFESQRAMLLAVMGRNGPRDVLANARVAMARGRSDGPWRAAPCGPWPPRTSCWVICMPPTPRSRMP